MSISSKFRHLIVAAVTFLVGYSGPLHAQGVGSDLLDRLKSSQPEQARLLDREIMTAWSRSGSASMDLLLRRGREALGSEDLPAAIEHFTALTDHAPEFAEGWHGLARAYFQSDLYGPALDALGHVLKLNPDHYPAIFGLGVLFQQFGDYSRADAAFRQVLALHPHHAEAKEAVKQLERRGIGRSL